MKVGNPASVIHNDATGRSLRLYAAVPCVSVAPASVMRRISGSCFSFVAGPESVNDFVSSAMMLFCSFFLSPF